MKTSSTALPIAGEAETNPAPDSGAISAPSDLLSQVIDELRPHLARNMLVRERLVTFWSFVVESRNLGATDVVQDDFRGVAHDCGLVADLGRNGAEFVEHVLQWGLRGFNPFEKGPLQ
jgi:hypothetical protein